MSKHTPGPWRVSDDNTLGKWRVYPPRKHVNARLTVLDVPGDEEANARLIAAAPELRAMVECAVLNRRVSRRDIEGMRALLRYIDGDDE